MGEAFLLLTFKAQIYIPGSEGAASKASAALIKRPAERTLVNITLIRIDHNWVKAKSFLVTELMRVFISNRICSCGTASNCRGMCRNHIGAIANVHDTAGHRAT